MSKKIAKLAIQLSAKIRDISHSIKKKDTCHFSEISKYFRKRYVPFFGCRGKSECIKIVESAGIGISAGVFLKIC